MTFPSLLLILCLLAFIVLCVYAAANDIRHFRLPNKVMLLIALLFLPVAFFVLEQGEALAHLKTAGLVLGVTFLLFIFKVFAAGDAKFLTVVSLWAGPELLSELILVTALAGGFLAIFVFCRQKFSTNIRVSEIADETVTENTSKTYLPYGVAISTGAIAVSSIQLSNLLSVSAG